MPIRELKFRIRIIVEKDEDGFVAYCPELKGLLVGGATKEEIEQTIPDAIQGYIDSLIKHNDPIPVGVLESDCEYTFSDFLRKFFKNVFHNKGNGNFIQEVTIPLPNAIAA
jgi:predicted RNase H-like HicB family nuclease